MWCNECNCDESVSEFFAKHGVWAQVKASVWDDGIAKVRGNGEDKVKSTLEGKD